MHGLAAGPKLLPRPVIAESKNDATYHDFPCFIASFLRWRASRYRATASGEGFFAARAIRTKFCCLFRDGRFELRASGREDPAPSDGALADGRKLAPLDG